MADVVGELLGGRYELQEHLGSGGGGAVHRARDLVLDRSVAIKMLHPGSVSDEVQRSRLRAEARLAGGLRHPGIAQIYDFGQPDETSPTSAPYVVMELIDGVSLAQVLRERGSLPVAELMTVLRHVAEALHVAHRAGIVHRDLKPGNIMLTPHGRTVLVDFGIATSAEFEPLTVTGTIVGSVDYLSPEQVEGGSATPRSDLYALGMVAYEALTGLRPFRRESQVATALAHLHDELPAMPGHVPSEVRELVLQMLARDPDGRPVDAQEVAVRASLLSSAVSDSPQRTGRELPPAVSAGRGGDTATVTLARSWFDRRRVQVAAAVALAVVAASLLVAARPTVHRVPDVRGMSASAAETLLSNRDLDVVERTLVDDPRAKRGTVLDQDPAVGSRAGDDTVMVLEVASGRASVVAAQLTGGRFAAAARELVSLGLVPIRTERPADESSGTVLAVGPTGRLPIGSTIELTVAVPLPTPTPTPTTGTAVAATSTSRATTQKPPVRTRAKQAAPDRQPQRKGKGKSKGKKKGKSKGKRK